MWLLLALLARTSWGAVEALDQWFARLHPVHATSCAVALYFTAMLPFGLLVLGFAGTESLNPSLLKWVGASLVAEVGFAIPYYICMRREEAYNVTPYFAATPLFVMLIAWATRGEVLSTRHALGAVIIIAGCALFSWDFRNGRLANRSIILLVLVSSFFFACLLTALREASAYGEAWTITALAFLGKGGLGLAGLAALPAVRRSIAATARATRGENLALALGLGFFDFAGYTLITAAFAVAPTAGHVAATGGLESVFCLFIVILLSHVRPAYYARFVFDTQGKLKLLLILAIAFGLALLGTG